MSNALAINIVLGLLVLAVIIGLKLWAISTAHHDHHDYDANRRRGLERRSRVVPEFPAHAERRRQERRYGQTATA